MGSEWSKTTLAEAIDLVSGGTPKTGVPEYWGGDIPWLSVADFNTGYRWVSTAEKSITGRGLSESATTLLNQGDVIISARGTVGVVAQLSRPMAFNQSCYGVRGKREIAETDFIYYALHHAVSEMKQVAHGGVFDTITRDTFKIIEVNLPPLPEQKAIAHILGALDNKIELNRKMNETLEAMARAIFKSWFVDFDPIPGHGLHREWQDSPLGRIPKGWEVAELGDITDVIDCLHSKKPERQQVGKPLLQLWNIRDDGLIDMSDTYWIAEDDYNLWISRIEASQGDCVVTNVGRVGAVAQIPQGLRAALGRNMTAIRCKEAFPYPTLLIECLLSSKMKEEILHKTDTGTILNALNVKNIPKLRFILPSHPIGELFEKACRPMRARMEHNISESRTLAAIRDVLLPKLLSGEIRIKDVEKFVEAAV